MKTKFKLIGIWLEVKFSKLFKIKHDSSKIPQGMYCYCADNERNEKEPLENEMWIKTCPYFRSTTKTGGIGCTFIGFYGFDFCLYDECKICSINEDFD